MKSKGQDSQQVKNENKIQLIPLCRPLSASDHLPWDTKSRKQKEQKVSSYLQNHFHFTSPGGSLVKPQDKSQHRINFVLIS